MLGYALEDAIVLLEEKGFRVQAEEVRSKKGLEHGDSRRVIRERYWQQGEEQFADLSWAAFQTRVALEE